MRQHSGPPASADAPASALAQPHAPRYAEPAGDERVFGTSWRPSLFQVGIILAISSICAVFGYFIQDTQNRLDAQERFSAISKRVSLGIVERMHRYEYGLRGARGVAASADGQLTRSAFSRYAATRQIDREFPGARGFGIVLRVPQEEELAFVLTRRQLDTVDFSIRQLQAHDGDRFVITFVEPEQRNREAVGLDIGSEPGRREAALQAARTKEATLTPPITLVQASGKRSGGMLLLLPILRAGASAAHPDQPEELVIGWSYAPLLIEEVLAGLDSEDTHYQLSLYDLDFDSTHPFYAGANAGKVGGSAQAQRVPIGLYGRRWEAELRPTTEFFDSLHQQSPARQALQAWLMSGALAALVATMTQLVDRTRGQRLELARRAAIVEGSSDAIIVQDLDGVIIDWNEGAERLFGYSKAQAQGQTATGLLLPEEREAEDADIRHTVADGGRVTVFETVRRNAQGELIPVSITASAIRDDSGKVVGSAKILRDGREAKAAEQRMRELNASLEDQVRERTALLNQAMGEAREANEAKSRFLANISHEIRTPMNAVIGMTHLLGKTRLDVDQAGMLDRIRTAGKTLLALLNDVLDLSKTEAGEMVLEASPFQLQHVVDQVASIAEVSAHQRGITFDVDSQADALAVVGDRTRLGQVILNLVTNAIKFTLEGGVTLQVTVGLQAQGQDQAQGQAPDAHGRPAMQVPITIRVKDTGIGIPGEVQPLLFRPFVQADTSTTRRFGGTGLGLSIVRQLVDLMGGKISLRSRVGEGSEFQVDLLLPVAQEAPDSGVRKAAEAAVAGLAGFPGLAGASEGTATAASDALRGRTILVVDDNGLNREVAARILALEGATAVLAVNGAEAVERVRSGDVRFDAVLMDVQMPIMDGLEATRCIRQLPDAVAGVLPIIGLTAGVSTEERTRAQAAGMDTVVGKPFDPDVLVQTLSERIGVAARRSTPRAEEAPAHWPRISGLDAAVSHRRLSGDLPLMRSMSVSLRELLIRNAQLCTVSGDDAAALTAHAAALHDLKSIAGSLGALTLMELAGTAERLLRRGALEEARVAMRQLMECGREAADAIERQWPASVSNGSAASDRSASASPPTSEAPEEESGDLAVLLARLQSGA